MKKSFIYHNQTSFQLLSLYIKHLSLRVYHSEVLVGCQYSYHKNPATTPDSVRRAHCTGAYPAVASSVRMKYH